MARRRKNKNNANQVNPPQGADSAVAKALQNASGMAKNFKQVLVIGIDEMGIVHIEPSAPSFVGCHWMLNRALHELNMMESIQIRNNVEQAEAEAQVAAQVDINDPITEG